jgi:penicillin-binding protein 1A
VNGVADENDPNRPDKDPPVPPQGEEPAERAETGDAAPDAPPAGRELPPAYPQTPEDGAQAPAFDPLAAAEAEAERLAAAEAERLAAEAEERRQREAERLAAEEAQRRAAAAEAERQARAAAEAERQALEEAEKQARAAQAEAERQRQAAAEAERQRLAAAEAERQALEAEATRAEEAARRKREEEAAFAVPPMEIREEPKAEPPPARSPLPPHYFRAAGDPDEPPPEPDRSLLGRMSAAGAQAWSSMRAAGEPVLVAFAGAVRAFGSAMWRGLGAVKRPRSVRETAVWAGWAAGGVVATVIGFFVFVTWDMPSTDDLWEARQGQSITFLDRNGNVILREGAQNAPPVALESLPPYVAQAFIAIEDKRFYDHWGVDISGVMRAGAENLRAGRVVQGGSTITQQLAKNLFLTNERSWRRKAQEVAMALWLERRFSKDEILALYLSRVYFGAGAYGVEAAAERYFDRPARELTLLQAAMIAGLVKAPSRLNPARQDIAAARERAELVLTEMVAMGFISDAERQAAAQEELVISHRNPAGILGYFRDWIDPLLNDIIGYQRDDFVVETTLDIAAQRAGAEAIEAVLAEQGEERRVGQGALLAMDDTGGVRAMVGGRDYDTSQFNRTWQARRQPGSSFKFFIYLTAMENGLTPWSIRQDAPLRISVPHQPDWTPGNYTGQYAGPVSLTSAWAQSYNTVAIRIAREVGHDKVLETAQRLGVTSPLRNYHSLALGAQELTMLELTQAYGAMSNGGYRMYAHGVSRIRRANNNETMWSWRAPSTTRVIEERPLRFMNALMVRTVEAGTGTRVRMPGRQIAGKTGTTNDYRDAWFIGFTPGYVAAVWVGNDNFTVTNRVTGGSLPAEIWARFAPTALQNVPVRPLDLPREEDFDMGAPDPEAVQAVSAVGAPLGAIIGAPDGPTPPDDEDRSLDFGPEG